MNAWKPHPSIYQINTAVWLNQLSAQYHRPLTLANVPDDVLTDWADNRLDAIWLMGIWQRGALNRASALNYIHEYRGALPDVREEDVIGSAYAIGNYSVNESFGGREGLAKFRRRLKKFGLKLILDFVPNHVGLDHPWLVEHPDYFIQGDAQLLKTDPGNFFTLKHTPPGVVYAHGRDPNFPGWIDTVQLNPFSAALRTGTIAMLRDIAEQCDGIRCDMAMLMMDHVVERTWGWRGIRRLPKPYWIEVIGALKQSHPDFLFIAESYWNLEYDLQQQGFDYTYDKVMYDRLMTGDHNGIMAHLSADLSYLLRNLRFIENHDEPRAASRLGLEAQQPAAVLISTVPGGVLYHDGQFIGRKVKLPVQIGRQPKEHPHYDLKQFYELLRDEASAEIYRYGQWVLFPRHHAGEHTDGYQHILAYGWQYGEDYRLILLNLSGRRAQACVDMHAWQGVMHGKVFHASDALTTNSATIMGDAILEEGLLVDLDPYVSHIYHLSHVKKRARLFIR